MHYIIILAHSDSATNIEEAHVQLWCASGYCVYTAEVLGVLFTGDSHVDNIPRADMFQASAVSSAVCMATGALKREQERVLTCPESHVIN